MIGQTNAGGGDKSFRLITTVRLDQTVSDPTSMVSVVEDNGVIDTIRNNSHRYLGVYTAPGTMTLCQLDDYDSNFYKSGEPAVLTGAEGDVFVKLPRFSYKAEETSPDVWDISFCYGGRPTAEWNEWDGKQLIGAFTCFLDESSRPRSCVGPGETTNVNYNQWRNYVDARGAGFCFGTWQAHCVMATLFLGYYKSTNSQGVLGGGADVYNIPVGDSASMGMTDTRAGVGWWFTSFWGLENWHNLRSEWLYDVESVADGDGYAIYVGMGNRRKVKLASIESGYSRKMLIGPFLDFVSVASDATSTTGFCDDYSPPTAANKRAQRSGIANLSQAGVFFLTLNTAPTYIWSNNTIRLCFVGDLIEESDSSKFKALTPIG